MVEDLYKLRRSDFKPFFIGLAKYLKRNKLDYRNKIDSIRTKIDARSCALVVYNLGVIGVIGVALGVGLEKLVN